MIKKYQLKVVLLLIFMSILCSLSWYGVNYYAAGLIDQTQLIEFGYEDDFNYCNDWRPDLLDPDATITTINFNKRFYVFSDTTKGKTPLVVWATKMENLTILKRLNDKGANLNAIDYKDLSPLHYAIIYGYDDIIHFLLYQNVALNIQDFSGKTPLRYAYNSNRKDRKELIQSLLDRGADPKIEDVYDKTILHDIIKKGDIYTFKLFINIIDVNSQDNEGKTLLHKAVACTSYNKVLKTFQQGSNFNNRSQPIIPSNYKNRIKIIKYLLSKGANIDSLDFKSKTPLFIAIDMEDIDMAKFLIKNGAKVYNPKALYLSKAYYRSDVNMIKLLLSEGVNVRPDTLAFIISKEPYPKDKIILSILMKSGAFNNKTKSEILFDYYLNEERSRYSKYIEDAKAFIEGKQRVRLYKYDVDKLSASFSETHLYYKRIITAWMAPEDLFAQWDNNEFYVDAINTLKELSLLQ